jgi:predicted RNase H-like HicB family nuclease
MIARAGKRDKAGEVMKRIGEIIFLIEESEEGGYEAKALGYSIYTQAEDFDSLKEAVRDAIRCHFEEEERPQIIRLHMVKDEVVAL